MPIKNTHTHNKKKVKIDTQKIRLSGVPPIMLIKTPEKINKTKKIKTKIK